MLRAKVKVLQRLPEKTYVIQNGPYHRRFLDGYYPYHVGLTVHYSKNDIRLGQVVPEQQDGFDVTETKEGLSIDSWFKGILRIRLEFTDNES